MIQYVRIKGDYVMKIVSQNERNEKAEVSEVTALVPVAEQDALTQTRMKFDSEVVALRKNITKADVSKARCFDIIEKGFASNISEKNVFKKMKLANIEEFIKAVSGLDYEEFEHYLDKYPETAVKYYLNPVVAKLTTFFNGVTAALDDIGTKTKSSAEPTKAELRADITKQLQYIYASESVAENLANYESESSAATIRDYGHWVIDTCKSYEILLSEPKENARRAANSKWYVKVWRGFPRVKAAIVAVMIAAASALGIATMENAKDLKEAQAVVSSLQDDVDKATQDLQTALSEKEALSKELEEVKKAKEKIEDELKTCNEDKMTYYNNWQAAIANGDKDAAYWQDLYNKEVAKNEALGKENDRLHGELDQKEAELVEANNNARYWEDRADQYKKSADYNKGLAEKYAKDAEYWKGLYEKAANSSEVDKYKPLYEAAVQERDLANKRATEAEAEAAVANEARAQAELEKAQAEAKAAREEAARKQAEEKAAREEAARKQAEADAASERAAREQAEADAEAAQKYAEAKAKEAEEAKKAQQRAEIDRDIANRRAENAENALGDAIAERDAARAERDEANRRADEAERVYEEHMAREHSANGSSGYSQTGSTGTSGGNGASQVSDDDKTDQYQHEGNEDDKPNDDNGKVDNPFEDFER